MKTVLLFELPCGPHKIPVFLGIHADAPEDVWGYTKDMVIYLATEMEESLFYDTLVHEAVHVVEQAAGFDMSEQNVTTLGCLLAQMLGKYLMKEPYARYRAKHLEIKGFPSERIPGAKAASQDMAAPAIEVETEDL